MNTKIKVNYPEIRIKNAWLVRDNVSVNLHKLWGEEGEELASYDEIDEIVAKYQTAWKPYEHKILEGMSETLGLTFRQNIIDVYIAPWFYAFSDPMVIGVTYDPNRFVEVLTHELLHRLLTDNNQTLYDTEYDKQWAKIFGEHDFTTLVHIPVHAGLQAIFDDVLGEPERTKRDKAKCKKHNGYREAWEYVEKDGYKEIIAKLKKMNQG